eukprot:2306500-Rhodomonas_salina.1
MLRLSATTCAGPKAKVRVSGCVGLGSGWVWGGYEMLCQGVLGCVGFGSRLCQGVSGCVRLCQGVSGCVRVCQDMSACVNLTRMLL